MKQFIKSRLTESLLVIELNEGILGKSLTAALMLTMGSMSAQMKPIFKQKIDSIMKVPNLTPQQKRAEVQKIVQLNRDEISGKKREDFLRNMAASGFTDEEEYKKYLAKNAKKPNASLDGLEVDAANKRGKDKGSCTTNQTSKGQSLKDTK
jgi:hypothetical protein